MYANKYLKRMENIEYINMDSMKVLKRNGDLEEVSFDKVLRRMKNLSTDLNVNSTVIAQKICTLAPHAQRL